MMLANAPIYYIYDIDKSYQASSKSHSTCNEIIGLLSVSLPMLELTLEIESFETIELSTYSNVRYYTGDIKSQS